MSLQAGPGSHSDTDDTDGRAERVGAVAEGGVSDIESAHSDATVAAAHDAGQPPGRPATPAGDRNKRRSLGSRFFGSLRKLWIPIVVIVVIGAGGFTVSRLHGIFGTDNSISYDGARNDAAKPFDPQHLKYEVFGPPGTLAQISYFDGNGDPKFIKNVGLPWTLEFPISTAASIGSIAAQGDSDMIGCRISVDGVVKDEKVVEHEASSFASCALKAA